MSFQIQVAGLLAVFATAAITGVVRFYALRANMLDLPNYRSSHAAPTPRGGGLAIVLVVCVGMLLLAMFDRITLRTLAAIVPPALLVALAGFLDDRGGLSPVIRLAVHLGAAAMYLAVLGGVPLLGISWIDNWPLLSFLLVLLGLVWLLNLFNFMDGIDGIAGVELVFCSFSLSLVMWRYGVSESAILPAVVLGSAGLGFLAWNWPPAKIFMGDVGSGFSGIALGMIALLAIRESAISVWVVLTLLGLFISDATVTLLRRALRGERLYDAHRIHAYQWLSRRWGSHTKVVIASLAVNVLWLLPLALLAQALPAQSQWITLIAYIPLVCIVLWAGGGRAEQSHPAS